MRKSWRVLVTATLLACSSVVLAVPFNSFDPRSMAMGGAGVAVGDAGMAPFFNPALLTVTREEDDFSLDLPIVGARVYDAADFSKGDFVNSLQDSMSAYNAAQTSANLQAISDSISALSSQLTTLSDKPLQAELGAGTVIGVPNKSFGAAFYADGWVAVGGIVRYKDGAALDGFATAAGLVAGCNGNAACIAALPAATVDPYFDRTTGQVVFNTGTLQSDVDIRGVGISEVGLAMSREFGSGSNAWGLGITPKIVGVSLFDYTANVNNGDAGNTTESDYTAKYSYVNFDLGLAKDYGNGWRTGLVVKNVIPHTLDFKRAPVLGVGATPVPTGDTISLRPQSRIGASHTTGWSTVAMDIDLTANDPAGFEKKSQYVSLGAELNAWDWMQLRLGYRANLKDSARNIPSIGFGFAPFGVMHLDFAITSTSNEAGASARLAFTF